MKRALKLVGAALLLLAAALGLDAFWLEPDALEVTRTSARIDGLPPLRIAAIADVHGGARFIDATKLARVVALTEAQQPDVIVLLGDYLTGHRGRDGSRAKPAMSPDEVAAALGKLHAPHGVFAVLGNHDWWFDHRAMRAALERAGLPVLEDDAIPLPGAKDVWLVGLADQMESAGGLGTALAKVPAGAHVIALVHEPDVFHELPSTIALTLAGHTHGGQVVVPLLGPPVTFSRFGYARGWYERDARKLFVTSGIGTSLLPVRFGVRPEIAIIDVNR